MDKQCETLQCEVQNQVITLTLNRPQVHNAFNNTMLQELVAVLNEINDRDDLRVVIITGAGKSFSAGADLNWMKEIINYSYEENLQDSEMIAKVFHAIYTLKKPVIAAINGAAIGGGMGFVGAADIVIASAQAQFSLSEVRIGMAPACICPYLLKKVPEGALKELFITGMRFDPAKALSIGLINYVVEHDKLMEYANDIARELLQCGPQAISICKELFAKVPEMDLASANRYTVEVIARLRTSAEAQEGMKAFLEKRSPAWRIKD